jgi:hypothetical protein
MSSPSEVGPAGANVRRVSEGVVQLDWSRRARKAFVWSESDVEFLKFATAPFKNTPPPSLAPDASISADSPSSPATGSPNCAAIVAPLPPITATRFDALPLRTGFPIWVASGPEPPIREPTSLTAVLSCVPLFSTLPICVPIFPVTSPQCRVASRFWCSSYLFPTLASRTYLLLPIRRSATHSCGGRLGRRGGGWHWVDAP